METNGNRSTDNNGNIDENEIARGNETKFKWTVEITIFLTMFAVAIAGAPISNLIMYRTCVHALSHPVDECRSFLASENINHTIELENEVQKYATVVFTVKSLMESIVPAILSVFIGAWSDRHGRRPLIVWPVFGIFVSSAMTVVYSLVEPLGPWWVILPILPFSMSGGFLVLFVGSICYVSDVSTTEKRTFRILGVNLVSTLATSLGSLISPYLMRVMGNTTFLLLFVSALYAFAYSYTVIFIMESLKTSVPATLLTVVNFEHLKQLFGISFMNRPNYGRSITLLVVAASSLSILAYCGNTGVEYLYTRNKIHWTMKDYTTFSSISTAMYFCGGILAIGVLQKLFGISDLSFTMIAFLFDAVEFTIKSFATKTWHMYFGSAVSLFGSISGSLLRSFVTKTNNDNDVGKVMSLISSSEAIFPLLAPIAYNSLYIYTIDTFPGAFYLMSASIDLLCFFFVVIIRYLQWRSSTAGYQIIDTGSGTQ